MTYTSLKNQPQTTNTPEKQKEKFHNVQNLTELHVLQCEWNSFILFI